MIRLWYFRPADEVFLRPSFSSPQFNFGGTGPDIPADTIEEALDMVETKFDWYVKYCIHQPKYGEVWFYQKDNQPRMYPFTVEPAVPVPTHKWKVNVT